MGEDTSKIRAAIDDARTQLGNTLEALSFKTDVPARASEAISQTVDAVKATVEEKSETMKANIDEVSAHAREFIKDASSTLNQKLNSTSETLNQKFNETSEALNQKIHETSDVLNQKISETSDVLNHSVKDVSHKAGEFAEVGREKIDKAKEVAEFNFSMQVDRVVVYTRENPLIALAIALGGGFVLGRLLAPKSR